MTNAHSLLVDPNTEAVFFDFDGVVADTVEDNYRAWRHVLADKLGLTYERERYVIAEGRRAKELIGDFLLDSGHTLDCWDELVQAKDEYYIQQNAFRIFDGVEELLQELKTQRKKCGLVSGGSSKRLYHSRTASVLPWFDVIVTSDDCVKTKPDPAPYLQAARMTGVSPEYCVVIENAPLGVASAKAAGMRCIAITSSVDAKHLTAADIIVPSIQAIRFS